LPIETVILISKLTYSRKALNYQDTIDIFPRTNNAFEFAFALFPCTQN